MIHMNNNLIVFVVSCLLTGISEGVLSQQIYYWTDVEGSHISNIEPDAKHKMFTVSQASHGKVYQWVDGPGEIHLSDTPPTDNSITTINEIILESYESSPEPERYSVINQATNIEEYRIKLMRDRLAKKRIKFEEMMIAHERKMIKQIEFYTKNGYGLHPDFYVDNQQFLY